MDEAPAKKKKVIKKLVADTISIKEVYELGRSLDNIENKCLFYLLYLSAARVSEALAMKTRDIEFIFVGNERLIIFSIRTIKRKDRPIRKVPAVIEDTVKKDKFMYEKLMSKVIEDYISDKLMEEHIFTHTDYHTVTNYFRRKLSISVDAVNKNTGKITENIDYKIHPHYLRHCRITHLRSMYGFDALDLKQAAGWKDIKMTDTYLHMGWKNLYERMVGK